MIRERGRLEFLQVEDGRKVKQEPTTLAKTDKDQCHCKLYAQSLCMHFTNEMFIHRVELRMRQQLFERSHSFQSFHLAFFHIVFFILTQQTCLIYVYKTGSVTIVLFSLTCFSWTRKGKGQIGELFEINHELISISSGIRYNRSHCNLLYTYIYFSLLNVSSYTIVDLFLFIVTYKE